MSEYNRDYYSGPNASGSGLPNPPQRPFVYAETVPGITIPERARKVIGGFVTLITIGGLIAFNVVHDSRTTKQKSHPVASNVPATDCRTAHFQANPYESPMAIPVGSNVWAQLTLREQAADPGADNLQGRVARDYELTLEENPGVNISQVNVGQIVMAPSVAGMAVLNNSTGVPETTNAEQTLADANAILEHMPTIKPNQQTQEAAQQILDIFNEINPPTVDQNGISGATNCVD